MDSVLAFLDDDAKKAAFEHYVAKLDIDLFDLDILRICIQLLSPGFGTTPEGNEPRTGGHLAHEQLWNLILSHIPREQGQEALYKLADLCFSNASAAEQVSQRIHARLAALLDSLRDGNIDHIQEVSAYITFLKCSFWLPSGRFHLANLDSIRLLPEFMGVDGSDGHAHEAYSALFSLLRSRGSSLDIPLVRLSLNAPILGEHLWRRLQALQPAYFTISTTKVFRTWYQWISQAVTEKAQLTWIYDNDYWIRLQLGLLNGFAEQRKHCLGIIRQSLLIADKDIVLPTMIFRTRERALYLRGYQQFSTLFETIVLNRYSTQARACLPELSNLLGKESGVTMAMTVILLRAAIESKVQEGLRKMVGNWYMDQVISLQLDPTFDHHVSFLLEGLLAWATEGSHFTSSLTSTRGTVVCPHGDKLASVIAIFITKATTIPDAADKLQQNQIHRALALGIIRFISISGSKIFQPAILYLLEGLIMGFKACPQGMRLQDCLTTSEVSEIVQLSRLVGLSEIMGDLYSIYCGQLCDLVAPDWKSTDLPGYNLLTNRLSQLDKFVDQDSSNTKPLVLKQNSSPLREFLDELLATKHSSIQGTGYAPACRGLIEFLNHAEAPLVNQEDLFDALEALWEEAERREFIRSVAVHLPSLLFHPTCIRICIIRHTEQRVNRGFSLEDLLSRALGLLQILSKGRPYILSILAKSVRKAVFTDGAIVNIIPVEDYVLDFINVPPVVGQEFLFEVVAAEKLQFVIPHRTYVSYYGQRESFAYAAVIDVIRSFPDTQSGIARRIFDRLLDPWINQTVPVPIKSHWKNTFQLQTMLLLSHFCFEPSEAETYLIPITEALKLESWPRYRFLLEWILARIYMRSPSKCSSILEDLESLGDVNPIHVASLIKIGFSVAAYESKEFASKLAIRLNSFCASPKSQIRHEAHFTFPKLFDLARKKSWVEITNNDAFVALDAYIRTLDKFGASPWTIRTLKIDHIKDFNLTGIFQGPYLWIESPEKELVASTNFELLPVIGEVSPSHCPRYHVPIGTESSIGIRLMQTTVAETSSQPNQIASFLQIKAGYDLDALHPSSSSPSMQKRPASVIMVASLIDNPTNLGGLSRISESFGLEAMYINDIKKTGHKEFKATSVTSEKHFPIHELKEGSVPAFLIELKRRGYEVVGIEQTDRSEILGQAEVVDKGDATEINRKSLGMLPMKCALVLGSEKDGISAEILAVVDRCVEIKTVGVTRSLNVQTAGGIAVYEWWREWGGKI